MNISNIPPHITTALRRRRHSDAQIASMTPEEAFFEYCAFIGLAQKAPSLVQALDALRKAASNDKAEEHA